MKPVRIDWTQRRVWILNQRIHHGPWAIAVGIALFVWGMLDLHDIQVWFVKGPQL